MQEQTVKLTEIYNHPLYPEAQAVLHNIFNQIHWLEKAEESHEETLAKCSEKVEQLKKDKEELSQRVEELLKLNQDLVEAISASNSLRHRMERELRDLKARLSKKAYENFKAMKGNNNEQGQTGTFPEGQDNGQESAD